jgi:hypothetical protein
MTRIEELQSELLGLKNAIDEAIRLGDSDMQDALNRYTVTLNNELQNLQGGSAPTQQPPTETHHRN